MKMVFNDFPLTVIGLGVIIMVECFLLGLRTCKEIEEILAVFIGFCFIGFYLFSAGCFSAGAWVVMKIDEL